MEKKTKSLCSDIPAAKPTTEPENIVPKPKRSRSYKPPQKEYKVEIIYSPLTEEEARLKRAIIEGIIKKTYLK